MFLVVKQQSSLKQSYCFHLCLIKILHLRLPSAKVCIVLVEHKPDTMMFQDDIFFFLQACYFAWPAESLHLSPTGNLSETKF